MIMLSSNLGLGIRTDLMLLKMSAQVTTHRDGVSVVSPANPNFYFGNCFFPFNQPTSESTLALRQRFAELIGGLPSIEHESFAWSCQEADEATMDAFRREGFRVERSVVLACKPEHLQQPKRLVQGLVVRRAAQSDVSHLWRLYTRFAREQEGGLLPRIERTFLRSRIREFMGLVEAGAGDWHIAMVNGRPVAALGLFFEGPIGRFQEVLTDSRWRNRGLCAALVHRVSQDAFDQGAQDLVMVADASYHALRIYRSLGFRDVEGLVAVCKSPRPASPAKAE
jgi:N-acetylglutamate synthase-like GNAT family acetyltransferase